MKCEEKEKDVNLDEVTLTVEVDSEVIDGVRKGEITQLCLNIDDDNKNQILENINGHLILVTDELPNIYLVATYIIMVSFHMLSGRSYSL